MIGRKTVCLPFGLIALAGCSSQTIKLCEAATKRTLINPETAEFYDSRELSPAEYLDVAFAARRAITKAPIPVETQAQSEITMANMMRSNPETNFATFRLRAEGKLGNKITNEMLCMSDGKDCLCSDPATDIG